MTQMNSRKIISLNNKTDITHFLNCSKNKKCGYSETIMLKNLSVT